MNQAKVQRTEVMTKYPVTEMNLRQINLSVLSFGEEHAITRFTCTAKEDCLEIVLEGIEKIHDMGLSQEEIQAMNRLWGKEYPDLMVTSNHQVIKRGRPGKGGRK